MCVVLPRAPCRGVFPDPRGPPSGTCLWQPALFDERARPGTPRAGDRHRALVPAVQRIAVASRPGRAPPGPAPKGKSPPLWTPWTKGELALPPATHPPDGDVALPLDTHRSGRSAALNRRGGSTAKMPTVIMIGMTVTMIMPIAIPTTPTMVPVGMMIGAMMTTMVMKKTSRM